MPPRHHSNWPPVPPVQIQRSSSSAQFWSPDTSIITPSYQSRSLFMTNSSPQREYPRRSVATFCRSQVEASSAWGPPGDSVTLFGGEAKASVVCVQVPVPPVAQPVSEGPSNESAKRTRAADELRIDSPGAAR